MTYDTKLAGKITVIMLLPAVLVMTTILWATATKFDHTEWKAISSFAAAEGSIVFASMRWLISRRTFRSVLKEVVHHIWESL